MIVVTGGAGFIGSALVWRLNQKGYDDILIVDRLHDTEKWMNLVSLRYADYLDKDDFIQKLESGYFGDKIDAILHMGACSATTELNADYLMENNYRYTARIATWQNDHKKCRFIYASSAATYGDGANGYSDNHEGLLSLRPLNMYGYSKHLFDLWALRNGYINQIVGLKFFNVYGPNENHKGDMRSVINKAFPVVRDEGIMRLFKSHVDGYGDGDQKRDFLYVKDAVEMALFFLDNKNVNGIFNIGTGIARTWNDVANSLFNALNKKTNIEYIPMPAHLREKYQYYTCADTDKIKKAGCSHVCMSLEDAIFDYVNTYLSKSIYLDPNM